MSHFHLRALGALACWGPLGLALLGLPPSPATAASLTILSAGQRREVTPLVRGEVELLAIDEVLAGQEVTLVPDLAAAVLTLQRGGHEVVLHGRKSLASVDGDLRLLSAPVQVEGGRFFVVVDSLARVLPPLLEKPVEWRPAERVLLIGKISVPRVAVSVYLGNDQARVVFDASERVPFRVQQEPSRITVAVPRDLLDVSLPTARPAGGILESVLYQGGRENVFVLNLGPRFRGLKAAEQETPPRLVIELLGPPLFAERPAALPLAPQPRPRATPAPEAGVRTIVIDPGHGGEETGAQGAKGTLEKDITLAVARKVRAQLVNARGLSVFLTRERDVEVSLDERTAIANNYKADLFLSIHANASRVRGASGSEVYFLSYQASDDESRRVAQLEGSAEGVFSSPSSPDLALILWDMAQAEHLEESSALASRLQEELAVVTGSEGRGVKQAPFRVLVGAAMPAALVEIAFISNPEEEKAMATEAYQNRLAAALARGIERYRRERAARLGLAPAAGQESSAGGQ